MIRTITELAQEYSSVLKAFLADDGEATLKRAYDLGRRSVGEGVGLLTMLHTHQKALEELLRRSRPAARPRAVLRAMDFVAECLAPYDMAHRGFQEAHANLRELNEECEKVMADQRRALRKAEAKYRAHVEHIPAVTFIQSVMTGKTMYVSPQIEAMLGFTPPEWLGDPDRWKKQLHPADRDRVLAEFSRFPTEGGTLRAEYRLLARAGREAWVHHEATLICDEERRPQFIQGILMDITDRKQAERAAIENENQFRCLFARCPDAILLARLPEATLVDANGGASVLFSCPTPDLLARSLFDLFPEEEGLRVYIERVRVHGEAGPVCLRGRGRRGEAFYVELSCSLIPVNGSPGLLGIARKISDPPRNS
ncbi:MAG: PAS domain S-box protein [Planctomycetes bacterium]|nr:PAS domain S-box protein [Planctomycetota bacterium]